MNKISCILFLVCFYSHFSLFGADQHPAAFSEEKYHQLVIPLDHFIEKELLDYAFKWLILLEGHINYDISKGIAENKIHDFLTRKNPALFPADITLHESIGKIYVQIIEKIITQRLTQIKGYEDQILEYAKNISDSQNFESFVGSFIQFYRTVKWLEVEIETLPGLKALDTTIKDTFTTAEKTLARLQDNEKNYSFNELLPKDVEVLKRATINALQYTKQQDLLGFRPQTIKRINDLKADLEKDSDKKTLNLDSEYQELEALNLLLNMGS